jgi:hypothetical protein
MEKSKNDSKSLEMSNSEEEDLEDLDLFIEKRKIQNEALKKIVGSNLQLTEKDQNKRKIAWPSKISGRPHGKVN